MKNKLFAKGPKCEQYFYNKNSLIINKANGQSILINLTHLELGFSMRSMISFTLTVTLI